MNSLNSPQSHGLRAIAFVLALAGSAYAGPGPAYWQSRTTDAVAPTAKSTSVAPVSKHSRTCTGSKLVPIVSMQPSWHNARGPLHAVQIGTRRVCTSCGTFAAMRSSWNNARGPLAPVATTAEHDCNASCIPAARA